MVKLKESEKERKRFATVLTIPLQGLLNFLLIVPFALAIYLSLTNWTPILGPWYEAPIVGGASYAEIIQFTRFTGAFLNTLIIIGVSIPAEFLLGLLIATALFNWNIKGKKIIASILLLPMMILPTVAGFTFLTLFFRQGAVNQTLASVFGKSVYSIDWINVPSTALAAIVLADVWQWTPFMFLLIYAGLTAIPADPIRAARVLGASEMQIYRRITLPMLKPIILIALIIRTLEGFKIFDIPFIMTQGGPGTSTETISIFLYKFGIEFARTSFVSAGALIVFVIVVVATIFASRSLIPKGEIR